jgi:hypothetical protein
MTDQDTGMADPSQVGEYVQDTYGSTVSSMSPQDRAEQLMAEANQNLAAEGVPAIGWAFGASGSTCGTFDASSWSMSLNETYFAELAGVTDTSVLSARYQEAGQTVYHEARHGEQAFRCCRERAGLGATAQQISDAMQAGSAPVPPMWVIEYACQIPIQQCDASQYQAEQWYESMYGAGAEHRRDTLTDPNAPYEDYRALPEEADAWRTDDSIAEGYRAQDQQ